MAGRIDKSLMEKQISIWQEWVARQPQNNKFTLNPDKEVVERLAEGVLKNEQNRGLKFCPCRMTLGDKEADKKLVCPCNFRSQKTWREKGECWCSLFVKEKL
jgi:ferredoxin-thioredoxin reductase catalytic chain